MHPNLDTGRIDGADPRTLEQIASRLSQIAAQCAALGLNSNAPASSPNSTSSIRNSLGSYRASELGQRVHSYLLARRARSHILNDSWFADPAWDILLDLFASRCVGRNVSISSACIAANVPPTTALRWIEKLVDEGSLVRENDPTDRRRAYLHIVPELALRLEKWIERYLPPSIHSDSGPVLRLLPLAAPSSAPSTDIASILDTK